MLKVDSKLDNLIVEILELDRDRLTDDLTPDEIEVWDSLTHLRMITAIEEAFGITLPMRDVMEMTSLSKIREIVATHVQDR